MEKFRIRYFTSLHLGIMQIGENTLSEIAYYSCVVGSAFEIIVSILILSMYQTADFGESIHIIDQLPTNNIIYIIIAVLSLAIKLGLLLGTLFSTKIPNVLVKEALLFLVSTCDQILLVVDSLLLGVMISESQFLILLAAVNLFFGFLLRLLNQVISSNYSFIYPYQFKKMPTFFTTILSYLLTCLFVVFQVKMNNDIFMTLFFVTGALKIIVELRFFYEIPYLNGNILSLKQAVFNNWLCFLIAQGGSLLFQIVCENTIVLFIILYAFGMWLNLTCMSYVKEKRLVADIESAENWEDINTKIQYSYELIYHDNLDKMSTISKEHFQKCKVPTCKCRWSQLTSPIDFRTQVFSSKSDIFQLKIFLKYYLLVLCQNFKERFSQVSQPWVVYISALSLLNLYPKLIYYSVSFQSLFSNEIGFSEKFIINFLKKQILQFIEEKNTKDSVLQIQKIKRVEELEATLSENIKKIAEIKCKIWQALLESPVEQHIIQKLFKSEIDQRKIILTTYNQIIKIPHKKLTLWRMMTNYCKNIVEDHNLERVVRKNVSKEDLIVKGSEGINTKEGSHPRKIEEFLNFEENYCLLKVGMNEKKLGYIEWHNENIYNMLGFSKSKRLVGESIDIFIPEIFRSYHHDVLKNWYQYPKTHKLNKLSETYMRTQLREFQSILLYIKILTMEEDCGVFAIISQSTRERFLVLDSDLNTVLSNNFIKDKLKSKINHPDLVLPLLSKDYVKLKEFKGKKFQQYLLKFSLISNYKDYYQQYQLQLSAIDPSLSKEEHAQQKQNITDKISSMITRIQGTETLEIDVLVKPITIKHQTNPVTYILVKQSIDEDSFNDENQKLKRKRENNNSTTFQVESSQNFHLNNTKTKEKKELDFQESESSISSTKNVTNRDFISKLRNKELLWLQKSLYICLFIYFLCEMVRLVGAYLYCDTLTEIITADISVNTFVQYAEAMYDNAMLNSYTFSKNMTGVTLDKSAAFLTLIDYNYGILIDELKNQSNLVHNKWIKEFSSQFITWVSGNGVANAFPVTVWFETWGKISLMASKNTTSSSGYMKLLNTNYQFLREASHKYVRYYPAKAQFFTSILKYMNIAILPINFITIIAILYFFNKYLNQKQKIRYDFIKIFTEIDQESIKSYVNHFSELENENNNSISEEAEEFRETGYLHRKVAVNKAKPTPLYRLYMMVIGLIIIFDLITTITTFLKADSLHSAYKLSSNIKESFHYEIESLIEIKQLGQGIRSFNQQTSLIEVNDQNFNQFKDNAIQIFNQFISDLQLSSNRMLQLLIGNICTILQPQLPDNLNDICLNSYSLQIIKAGTMTFSHYIVDIVLEEIQNFVNIAGETAPSLLYPEIMSNVSLVDGSISLTYRLVVVQKIQEEISKIIDKYKGSLISQTVGMVVATSFTLLAFVVFAYFFKKKENSDWEYIYGSLLIVPEKELLKASTVSKLVTQLKDKSLK